MQSLEHKALAQTARPQFKERQQSMAPFHPSHRQAGSNPQKLRFCPDRRRYDLNPRFDLQPVWMSALACSRQLLFGRPKKA
jgi:hypothetical protein